MGSMTDEVQYQVTRAGRVVYAGELEGLVEAATESRIRANDLVYDPTSDTWLFARNLPALAGFALRGRRAVGTESGDSRRGGLRRRGSRTLDERALKKRSERRQRAVRALALMSVLIATLVLVRMVPDEAAVQDQPIGDFIEDDRARVEATPTAVASTDPAAAPPTPAAPQPPPTPLAAATPPAQPAVAPPPTNPTDTPDAPAAPAAGAPAAGDPAAGAPVAGAPAAGDPVAGAAGDPTGAALTAAAPTGDGAAEPAGPGQRGPVTPPSDLVFDYAQRAAPGVFVEPSRAQRRAYADRYVAEGVKALTREEPPPGQARMDELLAARHRAEFAKLQLEALDPEHPELAQVSKLIEDIESAFDSVCEPANSARYCGLKKQWPDWPDAVVDRVARNQVEVGMTAEQARESWGRPSRFRREGGARTYCYDFLCTRSIRVVDQVVVDVQQ